MARKSSIELLDPRLKGAIEEKLRGGRHTLDDIVQHIRALGGDVSRSAVGRFAKDYTESLRRYSQAQEVAGRWVQQMREAPDGDLGRLLAEMLKTLAFRTMADAGEDDGEALGPLELARLARMVKDVAGTDRALREMEAKVRADIKAKVAAALDAAAASGNDASAPTDRIPPEALRRIREDVYGVIG